MILQYYSQFNDERLKEYKNTGFKYFESGDFKEYKKEQEKLKNKVVILRNTKLEKLDDDNDEVVKGQDYLEIGDQKYKVTKESKTLAKGYICVGENLFVRVQSSILLVIILLFGFLLGLGILLSLFSKDFKESVKPPIEKEDETDWDGNPYKIGEDSQAVSEYTTIPGYADIIATSGKSNVPLYNPEENTVYFIYTIVEKKGTEVYGSYSTINEAQTVVTNNTVNYTNYFDESTGDYKVKTPDGSLTNKMVTYKAVMSGNSYNVEKTNLEVLYFTKAIAPGNKSKEDWDVMKYLSSGEHDVQFIVSTYDVETEEVCYGAVIDVKVTVK